MHPSMTAQAATELDRRELIELARLRQASSQLALQRYHDPLPGDILSHAIVAAAQHTGIVLTQEQLEDILKLHPGQRAGMLAYGLHSSQQPLLDALACYFLGCTWPSYNSSALQHKFVQTLQVAASATGYEVNPYKTL